MLLFNQMASPSVQPDRPGDPVRVRLPLMTFLSRQTLCVYYIRLCIFLKGQAFIDFYTDLSYNKHRNIIIIGYS